MTKAGRPVVKRAAGARAATAPGALGRLYIFVSAAAVAVYSLAVAGAYYQSSERDRPLSFRGPALLAPVPDEKVVARALDACFAPESRDTVRFRYKVVPGEINGRPYFACYQLGAGDGLTWETRVVDGELIGSNGSRPIRSLLPFLIGGGGLIAVLAASWLYFRRPPPPNLTDDLPWRQRTALLWMLALIPVAGWLALALWPGVDRARKLRIAAQALLAVFGIAILYFLFQAWSEGEWWTFGALALLSGGVLFGVLGGRALLLPATDGYGTQGKRSANRPGGKRSPTRFTVQPPDELPSFRDVGGMAPLKRELKQTLGLLLAFAGEAEAYRITWNGILLHGPPGVGKTFIAKATAGEFGMNFIQVSTSALMSGYRGESARNVVELFRIAACNVPSILFFDEFDSVAQRRDDSPDQEARQIVNQLLQSLEEYRGVPALVVMAATNALNILDPAAIRPGRFDRHIRVDLPDYLARGAIFEAQLRGRPTDESLDLAELARRSESMTPAAIAQSVEIAALTAFRQATDSGTIVQLTEDHLLSAMAERGGRDRPTVENASWDRLVLPEEVKAELKQLVAMIEDPEQARRFGVEPPSGVLLVGPPGTGKTTIAQVIAAQAKCSFYPVSAADIKSKWLGESEKNVARLFERARENRPSIIFIDEIDGLSPRRGEWGSYDSQINELLKQIDGINGQLGVLVIGASNRPDQLDPALLRGGRLSKVIAIPPPDVDGRLALLRLFTDQMPLANVDLMSLAEQTEGLSGADLKALCQQAALQALLRSRQADDGQASSITATVVPDDFGRAFAGLFGRRPRSREPVE